MDTVNVAIGNGRRKLCMPFLRMPVCFSGTVAIRSEALASETAVAKPPTITTTSRRSPKACKASSTGP